jgi:sensor histidine kinase YesM
MVAVYVCAAFTPAILWLGRRFMLERGHLLSRTTLHVIFSALFSIVSAAIEAPLLMLLHIFPDVTRSDSVISATWMLLAYGFHGGMIRYWAVLAVQAIYRAHQTAKTREREALELSLRSTQLAQELSAAQLGALKMQLQPHFLFNTLGAIMVLSQKNQPAQVESMLARLSELLRLALQDVDAHEIPLHRELEFLRLYLSIEEVRFKDRLNVGIDAATDVSDALVPHMVLQPIVENAVRHGLGRSERSVSIHICAQKHGDQLRLQVSDDGPGSLSPAFEGTGIGLANVRRRLFHLYGSNAFLTAVNRTPQGAEVTIQLPFHTETAELGCS